MKKTVPKQVDNAFLHTLLSSLETWAEGALILDWKNVEELLPETHCAILHLRDLLEEGGLELRHESQKGVQAFGGFSDIFNLNLSEKPIQRAGVYISPVKEEGRITKDFEALKKFLKPHLPSPFDYTAISSPFSELYSNICQHAEAQKGYIFVTQPDKEGNITFFFSDPGVGIVKNIRDFFRDKKDEPDEVLIEYATQDRVSTKSQIQNQGRGLANVLSSIESMGGRVEICSGKGRLVSEANKKPLNSLPYDHKGTLIALRFNINRVEELDHDEYSTDIDF
ncbi:MAG: ATP-binding protein [Saprospiraceae bacterium]